MALAAFFFAWTSMGQCPSEHRRRRMRNTVYCAAGAVLVAGLIILRESPVTIAIYLLIAAGAASLGSVLRLRLKAGAPQGNNAQAAAKGRPGIIGGLAGGTGVIAILAFILELAHYSMTLRIFGYGLMLVLGFLVSIALAQWRCRRMGENPDIIAHVGILSVLAGIAGARAAFVIQDWDRFAQASNPLFEIINVSSGGLIYYGGLILASLVVIVYLFAKRVPVRRYLDILAVSIMIGLAFGRAGCLLNGCCYGAECSANFPLGMKFAMYPKPLLKLDRTAGPFSSASELSPVYEHQFHPRDEHGRLLPPKVSPDERLLRPTDPAHAAILGQDFREVIPPRQMTSQEMQLAQEEWSNPVKPSQAIGIANALVLAGLLALFYRLRSREGQVFALLAMLYPITRFVEEMIRDDNIHDLLAGVLTHNQYTSLVLFVLGVTMMIVLRFLPASAGPTWAQRRPVVQMNDSTPIGRKPKKR